MGISQVITVLRRWWGRRRAEGWFRPSVIWPLFLIVAFVAVFSVGFHLTGQYDTDATDDVSQRVWATLVLFTGSYIPLSDQWNAVPPPAVSLVGTVALTLTFLTAGSLLLLSRKVQDFVRVLRPTASLVVIGDGATAAAIIKSAAERKTSTIVVTDSRDSRVARAAKPSTPIIPSGQIEGALSTPSARRVIKHAKHIVIATDSDSLNMQLHAKVHAFRAQLPKRSPAQELAPGGVPTDIVVVRDPEYAELLRPNVIRGELPTEEVTCPAKNIAEHICHLLVAAVTGRVDQDTKRPNVTGAVIDVIEVVDDRDALTGNGSDGDAAPHLSRTIERWVTRLGWSMSLVRGQEEQGDTDEPKPMPSIRMRSDDSEPGEQDLTVRIFTGKSASAVTGHALRDRARDGDESGVVRIAVTNFHLVTGANALRHRNTAGHAQIRTGGQWIDAGAPLDDEQRFPLLVVDPDVVGLDSALVTDDTGTQWARTFDLTHGLMFSDGGWSVTGWQPGAPMGDSTRRREREARGDASAGAVQEAKRKARKAIANRYSSRIAVEHMLELLSDCGFELRIHEGAQCPAPPSLTDEDIEYIAVKEHSDWLIRRWPDTSRVFRLRPRWGLISAYSGSGANAFCYGGLAKLTADPERKPALRFAANYNRRIATETYPAIAASFGYVIAASDGTRKLSWPTTECTFEGCPCGGTGRVEAMPSER